MWFTLFPLVHAYQTEHYNTFPKLILRITVLPSLLMMFGWTAMQSFHVFLGAKRLKGKNIPMLRGILLIALFLRVLFVIPPVVDMLRSEIIRWQWLQTHNSYNSTDFALPGIWENIVWNRLSTHLVYYIQKYCIIFPVVGMTLWLVGFPKREQVTKE